MKNITLSSKEIVFICNCLLDKANLELKNRYYIIDAYKNKKITLEDKEKYFNSSYEIYNFCIELFDKLKEKEDKEIDGSF